MVNFPNNPTLNQTYTVGSKTWVWNGSAWDSQVISTTLSAVAASGSYLDLTNKPAFGTAALTDSTAYATAAQGIKADTALQPGGLATVATTGNYADLLNKPTVTSFSGSYTDLTNKPTLATVATTGSYTDLTNKPTVPTAISQLTNDSGYITSSYVTWANVSSKPTFATVATSGSYNDLANKPSIQAPLVSGTNIKTINGTSLLGSGDITISGGGGGGTTLPSQTGNNGKFLTTDGASLSWAAVSGGTGGSTNLTAITSNVIPQSTAKYNLGSTIYGWKDIYANESVNIDSTNITIGTIQSSTTQTSTVALNYPNAYTTGGLQVSVGGGNVWTGFNYLGLSVNSGDNQALSGLIYISFMGPCPLPNTLFTRLVGSLVTFNSISSGINFTVYIDSVSYQDDNAVQLGFHTTSATEAQKIWDMFVDGLYFMDWYDTEISATISQTDTKVYLTSPTAAESIPSDAYFSKNTAISYNTGAYYVAPGATFTKSSFIDNTPLEDFWIGPMYSTADSYAISYGNNASNTALNSKITEPALSVGSNLYIRYLVTGESVYKTATFNITGLQGAYPSQTGGNYAQTVMLSLVSQSGTDFTNNNTPQLDGIEIYVDVYWDTSSFTVQSENGSLIYKISNGDYTSAYPAGMILGYNPSPKITFKSASLSVPGISVGYNIRTKKPIYEGIDQPVITDSSGTYTANALPRTSQYASIINRVSIGPGSWSDNYAVSIGYNAGSYYGQGQTPIGGSMSVAIGATSSVHSGAGVAIGYGARVISSYGIVIGSSSTANGTRSIGIGYGTYADAQDSVAIGSGAWSQINRGLTYLPFTGGEGNYDAANQSLKFQLGTSTALITGTTYLSLYNSINDNSIVKDYRHQIKCKHLFCANQCGLLMGTSTVLIRAVGTLSSTPVWKIVEIKFALYAHKWSTSTVYNSLSNYDLKIISTTTLASSTNTGHSAWTPTLELGYMSSGSEPGLFVKLTKTDTVAVSAHAKFEVEVLNTPNSNI